MSDKTRRKDARRSTRPPMADVRRRSGAHRKVSTPAGGADTELAAAVGHEVGDLFAAIARSLEMALREADPRSELHATLTEIRSDVVRGIELAARLAPGQAARPRPVPVDVALVLSDFVSILRRLAGPRVRVELARGPGATVASIDRVQLERVVANLVLNARDSIEDDNGIVVIRTSRRTPSVPGSEDRSGQGVFVRITVTDTGRGMDAATLSRAFEPFFTTKRGVPNAGQGLATVRRIVEEAGGRVWATSCSGGGTEINVELPATPVIAPSTPRE